MKKILIILCLLAIPALLWAAEPMRVWKSKNGYSIQAAFDFARDSDPATVPLINNGKYYRVPFEKLSKADQDYVTTVRERSRNLDNEGLRNISRGIQIVPAGNRYALLIGVNEYVKPVKSLEFCVRDMELLSNCFQNLGVPKDNIILVTDNSPAARRPTGANIRRQIESVTSLMEPDDQLIIAFSGHGVMENGKSYLCPSDTNLKDINSIVSRDWVFEQLEKCKAKQKVFIIDACRNVLTFGGDRASDGARTLEDPIGADTHGFILIASCDKQQKSWEHPDIQHGVFTHFFAEGLSGAAADEDGYITIMGLFHYTSSRTKKYVYREFNEVQVPTFRQGGEMTDFCLAKVNGVSTPAAHPMVQNSDTLPSFSIVQSPSLPLKAGDRLVFKGNGVEFAFRWCPAGKFTVLEDDPFAGEFDDLTHHQVTLSKGFWMMETEVTQKQWKAIMGNNPSEFKDDDLPVDSVSWDDCQEFCEKCKRIGLPVQLPTEAQWEYACRAGTTGMYAGNLDDMAWYNSNSGNKPHSVGIKKPNAWGLYDMQGNVCEWCQDWYGDYPIENVTDPVGPSSGSDRIRRGGTWNSSGIGGCRSACRFSDNPGFQNPDLGFRCLISDNIKLPNSTLKPLPPQCNCAGDRSVITINNVEFAFRWCPAGTFMMGSPESEKGRHDNETQHQVTLTNGFWIMETEVTVGMFKAFIDETGYESRGLTPFGWTGYAYERDDKYSWRNPGFNQDDSHPVTCVSWYDAVAFCEWLSKKTGKNIHLPTSAQWEYACRAGSTTTFFWGNSLNGDKANCDGRRPYGTKKIGNFLKKTTPVRSYPANAWGIYDMHGNVMEYCQDLYYFGDCTSASEIDPTGPSFDRFYREDSNRVLRGGCWQLSAETCRSAYSMPDGPTYRSCAGGFRCVNSQ